MLGAEDNAALFISYEELMAEAERREWPDLGFVLGCPSACFRGRSYIGIGAKEGQ